MLVPCTLKRSCSQLAACAPRLSLPPKLGQCVGGRRNIKRKGGRTFFPAFAHLSYSVAQRSGSICHQTETTTTTKPIKHANASPSALAAARAPPFGLWGGGLGFGGRVARCAERFSMSVDAGALGVAWRLAPAPLGGVCVDLGRCRIHFILVF